MKLHKKIAIAGVAYELTTADIRLDLFNPGRAVFDVVADAALKGLVLFTAGHDPQQLQQVFYGYVENSFAIDKKQQRIFCRELCATLSRLVPVSLRNITLVDVLAAIAQETGLKFVTPEQDYTTKPAPAFYSMSSGYGCMDSLARVFGIPQFIWQQQGDGNVFVGSWQHSFWQGRDVELPLDMQAASGLANNAKIACIPKLRPGVFINSESYITKVHWDGEQQNISWDKNPWGTAWTNRSNA
jgi:hypothetical protein